MYLEKFFICFFIDFNSCYSFLYITQDHVKVLIISLYKKSHLIITSEKKNFINKITNKHLQVMKNCKSLKFL